MSRKALMAYYPPMLRQVWEFGRICDAFEPMLDQALTDVWKVHYRHSITYTDEDGLSRWESILGITPKGTDSLYTRKTRAIAQLTVALPPYTERSLRRRLSALCGESGYTFSVDPVKLEAWVAIHLEVKSLYPDVLQILSSVLPANILLHSTLIWNTHEMLKRYTHQELKARTHFGWKGEVINVN